MMYRNDKEFVLTSFVPKCANDTKPGSGVISKNVYTCDQNNQDTMATWLKIWQVIFNATRCKATHFGCRIKKMGLENI